MTQMAEKVGAFELHPQLARDCITLGDLALCRVLLMNDSNYPWIILVPRRAGAAIYRKAAAGKLRQPAAAGASRGMEA